MDGNPPCLLIDHKNRFAHLLEPEIKKKIVFVFVFAGVTYKSTGTGTEVIIFESVRIVAYKVKSNFLNSYTKLSYTKL